MDFASCVIPTAMPTEPEPLAFTSTETSLLTHPVREKTTRMTSEANNNFEVIFVCMASPFFTIVWVQKQIALLLSIQHQQEQFRLPALACSKEGGLLVQFQETFSDKVKKGRTGLPKTSHTRRTNSVFTNFLSG